MQQLYILKAISIKEKSLDDLNKEFEIVKINSPIWKTKSLESYMEFLKDWKSDKYKEHSEHIMYSLDSDTIRKSLINNVADFNDGGVYNFAMLISIPLDLAYAEYTHVDIENIEVYSYDNKSDKYNRVIDLSEDIYKFMLKDFPQR